MITVGKVERVGSEEEVNASRVMEVKLGRNLYIIAGVRCRLRYFGCIAKEGCWRRNGHLTWNGGEDMQV